MFSPFEKILTLQELSDSDMQMCETVRGPTSKWSTLTSTFFANTIISAYKLGIWHGAELQNCTDSKKVFQVPGQ
jgi:hypothetical protein